MLMSNLAVLLAQRQLRITRVATDTGISRTTLTALNQNDFKGVQVETMNTLCQYLGIDTGDLFDFVPFDLEFSMDMDLPAIENKYNQHDPTNTLFLGSIVIQRFDQDAFLKKTSISEETGKSEKTFDLTIRLAHDVTIPSIVGDDESEHDNIDIPISILLGHSSDEDTYKRQSGDFNHMWNEQLNTGFRSLFAKQLYSSVKDKLTSNIKDAVLSQTLGDFIPDWKRLHYIFSLTLNDAYSPDPLETPKIIITWWDLPF